MIQYPRYKRHRFSSFQVIIAGFAAVDLVGALLLMLPIAAQQRCVTPFHEALFTSTSALCVTGLVVQDDRQLLVWLLAKLDDPSLIQIGGLGVITVALPFALLCRAKDFPQAAQHDAGSHRCPADGRHRAADRLYSADHRPV